MLKTTFRKRLLSLALCLITAAALTPCLSAMEHVTIEDALIPLAGGTKVLTPQTGTSVFTSGSASVDYSNVAEGYVMVRYSGGKSKIKVQITRSGSSTYTYDLNASGNFEVFPLTSGNGTYNIGVFENVSGYQYAQVLTHNVTVQLKDSLLPFLYPSQYVNFNANSQAVKTGASLASNASDDLGIVSNVYNYVISNISYDTQKAQTAASGGLTGYLPVVDNTLSTGKGICFDYAALMTAMLRSQQIPTRLEVGYVSNGAYHAWISTYIKDVGWVNGVIQFDGQSWKLMDPTFASSGGQSSSIMQYIGNGSNYRTQYIY